MAPACLRGDFILGESAIIDREIGPARERDESRIEHARGALVVSQIGKDAAGILVAPVQPNAYELAEFRFSFYEPKLNDSPLIDNLDFLWSFGDETRPVRGRRCLHYFRRQTGSRWHERSPYKVKVEIRNAGELAALHEAL